MNRKLIIRITAAALALLLAAGFMGCGSAGGAGMSASTVNYAEKAIKSRPSDQDVQAGQNIHSGQGGQKGQDAITDDFRQSYADFSVELLKESRLEEPTKNMMLSPLSAMLALEMTRSGAAGETEEQMSCTLYGALAAPDGRDQLLSYMKSLTGSETARFHFANSIWLRNKDTSFVPDEAFLENAVAAFEAGIYGAPFDDSTVKDINKWVEQETDGMIKDMLKEIDPSTIMYLINAIAFEAEWREVYEEAQVRDADFYPEEGAVETVEMMYSEEGIYLEDEGTEGFIKGYKGAYAFVALKPREEVDIDVYLAGLSGERFTSLMDNKSFVTVEAGLPKFKAETQVSLNQMLKNMEMPMAFDETNADFSGMGQADGNIYISEVLQNTFIEVNEQGTRAGAATAVAMAEELALLEPEEPKRVILDRPFVYAIIDMQSGLPVFLGIMERAE